MLERAVIVGANGRLGAAVMARCDPASSRAAVRRPAGPDALALGAEGLADPGALDGFDVMINCAGLAGGQPEALHAANVVLAEALARQAKAAGVARFVQVSSFAVHGAVERIGPQTPLAPVSPYGKSKLEAERRLAALAGDGFEVACLRLPFMFGPDHGSLLGRLVGLARRTRMLPLPRPRPRRSMITFEDAAFVIEQVVETRAQGALAAADPVPFTFEALAEAFRAEAGRRLFLPWMPKAAVAAIGLVQPKLRDSVLTSSVLDPEANVAAEMKLPLGIERALAALVRSRVS